jgi:hypothetical protein
VRPNDAQLPNVGLGPPLAPMHRMSPATRQIESSLRVVRQSEVLLMRLRAQAEARNVFVTRIQSSRKILRAWDDLHRLDRIFGSGRSFLRPVKLNPIAAQREDIQGV